MPNTSPEARRHALPSHQADRSSPNKPTLSSDLSVWHETPFRLLAENYVELVLPCPSAEDFLPSPDQVSGSHTTQQHP